MGWRDEVTEDRPTFSLGNMVDGNTITGTFLDDGTLKDTRHGEALVVGIQVTDFPDGYEDMGENVLEEGEDYNLMSSSSRFQSALADFAEDLTGQSASITCVEGETTFDRTYRVE